MLFGSLRVTSTAAFVATATCSACVWTASAICWRSEPGFGLLKDAAARRECGAPNPIVGRAATTSIFQLALRPLCRTHSFNGETAQSEREFLSGRCFLVAASVAESGNAETIHPTSTVWAGPPVVNYFLAGV